MTNNTNTYTDDALDSMVDELMGNQPAKQSTPTEPEVVTPEFTEEENTVETEGKKYSELFGWEDSVLKNKPDFVVEMFSDTENVPPVDPNRVVDHTVMYPFVLAMQSKFGGVKPMLVGPTGSGKTTTIMHYCSVVGKGMYRINGRQDMESDTLIGRPWVGQNGMEYILGELPKALLEGNMVLIDEPWKIPSGIWMTLQRLMERGGVLQIDDMPEELEAKTIVPHENARIVLADNVVGTGDNMDKYGATMIQDGSTLNRIDLVIEVPYMEAKLEEELVADKFPEIVPKNSKGERGMQNVERMVRLLNLLRDGYDTSDLSSPVSLRNVFTWAEMAISVRDYGESFKWTILNRYADDAEKAAVRSHFYTVFGKEV